MGNLSEEHVGGAFIYSENPEELASWYKKHLCIDYHLSTIGGASFASFYYKDGENIKKPLFAWSIIKSKYRTKDDEDDSYMINYRVNDLDKMIAHLKSLGIEVHSIESNSKSNYTRIFDPEGNHIEIWEECK